MNREEKENEVHIKNKTKNLPNNDLEITKYSDAEIPLKFGTFHITIYRDSLSSQESIAIHRGITSPASSNSRIQHDSINPTETETTSVFTRIHSECLTGEVLGSLKCDCKDQLDMALESIVRIGRGIVIYLRQEGRGIGLGNKIMAYALQNQGLNTIEANRKLGFADDLRHFRVAGLILKDLGIKSINLNTNNPEKIKDIESQGITIAEVIPSRAPIQKFNQFYLQTKQDKMGHFLSVDDPSVP